MRWQRRATLLVVVLHLPLAFLAWYAARDSRLGILAAEVAVAVSFTASWWLLRLGRVSRELAEGGRSLLAEGDFTTRFRLLGQRDVDELVLLFNSLSEELRRERLRLEERDLLLGKLIAASPAGVVLLDLDGNVDLLNPAAATLLGIPAGEAVGRSARELPAPFGEAAATLPAGGARTLPFGASRRARISRAEFHDRGFERPFLLIEELTAELRSTERAAYERVIRLVSHEVNNSAGAIGSLLDSSREILGAGPGDPPAEVDEALDVAARRVRHLARFIDGFAEVVRLPAPQLAPLALEPLARDLVTLHRDEAARRSIDLRLRVEPDAEAVPADRGQIEQSLLNLLRNAFEASPDGGAVEISVGGDSRHAALSVRDSGPGISSDIADQLFTPFFSTKREGRGLGLTLVQEVARRHGGEVRLENDPRGGAIATLRLPRKVGGGGFEARTGTRAGGW
ncbi:MAG: PAS domain-containing sensor histidine kinase [Thermoanaerobaculia bacterium]